MLSKSYSRKIWRTAFLPVVDFFALLSGAGLIYLIRYKWLEDSFFGYSLGAKEISGYDYVGWSIILTLAVLTIYGFLGLYEVNRGRKTLRLFFNLCFGVFVVLLTLITYLFFYEYDTRVFPQGIPISRFILAVGGFLVAYFVLLGRGAVWAIENLFYKFGFGRIDVVVIGDRHSYLNSFLKRRLDIGTIYQYEELSEQNFDEIEQIAKNGTISEIYVFTQENEFEPKLAMLAERQKISFIFSPLGLRDYQVFDIKAINIGRKVFLELVHTRLDGWQVVLKRMFDIVFALAFLVCFSWLYIIVAILIKLDSPGLVFFGNKRVGPDGKEFTLWKFRRMKVEYCTYDTNVQALELEKQLIAQKDMRGDVLYKIKDDPRVTRVGKLIEKYSIDELPQFFNVLMGNMSIVGPRPHQLREVAKYSNHHFKVLNIKPGITGMAQVNGRSDLTLDEEVSFDTFYIENWNFWMDLMIVVKTPLVILFKRHKT